MKEKEIEMVKDYIKDSKSFLGKVNAMMEATTEGEMPQIHKICIFKWVIEEHLKEFRKQNSKEVDKAIEGMAEFMENLTYNKVYKEPKEWKP